MRSTWIILSVVLSTLSWPMTARALEEALGPGTDFTQEQQIGDLERTVGVLEHKVDRLEDQIEKLDRDVKELKRKV